MYSFFTPFIYKCFLINKIMYKKIAFTGTHSTGKSTLVKYLVEFKELKGYKFVTDVSRKLSNEGIQLNEQTNFKGQLNFFGNRAKELLNENFICDRSVYDVLAYSLASKHITPKQKKLLTKIFESVYEEYDLIFYIPIEFAMEKDGVRSEDEKYREEIRNIIEALLTKYPPKKIVELKGDVDQRLNKIMRELK